MIDTKDSTSTISWLQSRMKKRELEQVIYSLGLKNIDELVLKWDELEIQERINREVKRRLTAKDCTFVLPKAERAVIKKQQFIPRTFIDMTSLDD